ncbi:DNA repair protein RecN [Candidatus Magnetomonas plexicatena]|uniref:DNA repair protein RecN n=1 Tax=Candidatus Magnetomonas plexicatena TaxID=2552947 RepID=UPI001C761328|nr:DNA repair protein RecN [Nitrospirales bacterium LBB_01]
MLYYESKFGRRILEAAVLKELSIRNFAIVDSLRLEFTGGLNVLTGETGAGKSIIVDALELVLGGKAGGALIRTGANEASVEAFFDIAENEAATRLGIDIGDGLIIRRVISSAGKNRVYVNGSMVNLQNLLEIGESLLDIHGQHEHQSLMSRARQMRLVDSFGKIEEDVRKYKEFLSAYRSLTQEKDILSENLRQRNQRIDVLRYQIEEIDAASVKQGEKESLTKELTMLSNLTTIKELSESSYEILHSGDFSVNDRLSLVSENLMRLSSLDEHSAELNSMAKEALSYINELCIMLRSYKENVDLTGGKLDDVEIRLELIKKIEKKYGNGTDEIYKFRDEAQLELDSLLNAEERLESLEAEIDSTRKALTNAAYSVSEKRKAAASALTKDVNKSLRELAFKNARFEIKIESSTTDGDSLKFLSDGADTIEFLFSANPGEPLKTIQKVASGGELSRVMLALKSAASDCDDIGVLVFDEVDAGIGGETADAVGEKLKKLSARHQVFCITHLPQIASKADNHAKIIKDDTGTVVNIEVQQLTGEARVCELARMLSGAITDISLEHARELLAKNLQSGDSQRQSAP